MSYYFMLVVAFYEDDILSFLLPSLGIVFAVPMKTNISEEVKINSFLDW
jgi:hypothetical protein